MIKLDGTIINFKSFPNRETLMPTIKKNDLISFSTHQIEFKYESDIDFIRLMFLKKYLDNMMRSDIILKIKYMPYSRMDRKEGHSCFTLKYICDFINSLEFKRVIVCDPHSDVTCGLLNNSTKLSYIKTYFNEAMRLSGFNKEKDSILFPDSGAYKNYGKYFIPYNQLVGVKERDFESGRIKKLNIYGKLNKGGDVLIIDDLCSKGGTFLLSANRLLTMGCRNIYLFVAHCEDTIFEGSVLETNQIKHIYTTDSILTKTSDKITILNERIKP